MMESRSFADDFAKAGRNGSANGHNAPLAVMPLPLARRPDFRLGGANIRPSVRTIEGPGGNVEAEPRVMQVLLALADANGAVLTRDDLMRTCWHGQIVGDDSVNRAIAEARRIARETQADFAIETIPRIGYRLKAEAAASLEEIDASPSARPSRRWVMGGAAVAAVTSGLGLWTALRDPVDPRAAPLIERGEAAMRLALPDSDAQGVEYFQQAVAIEPDNPRARGLLALALRNAFQNAEPQRATALAQESELAARRALALDPEEGNALAAIALLRPYYGEWAEGEDRLRAVLAKAPDNFATRDELEILLQSVGRSRDSWAENQRAAALEPLSPIPQFRRAIKLWIFGRQAESDQTVDRALQNWPRHPGVWNARLFLFALTGRPEAALSMIDDEAGRPATIKPPAIAVWRTSLKALATRAPQDVAAARAANLAQSTRSPGFAVNAIMVLSALGELDAAFAVANGYLLRQGTLIGNLTTGRGQMPVNDQQWRKTMMLFVPATAAMRADPRFMRLCDEIGLVRYWRRRKVLPDYMS